MTKKEKSNNLLKVIETIDGLEYFTQCGLGMEECNPTHPCIIHNQILKVRENMIKNFGKTTIEKLGAKISSGELFIMRKM